jgi:hypothetical protein
LVARFLVASDELWAATYIVRRTALQIWQVSDSITISTNTHPIRTLTWAVSNSWADAANGPLARVNICGIINIHISKKVLNWWVTGQVDGVRTDFFSRLVPYNISSVSLLFRTLSTFFIK